MSDHRTTVLNTAKGGKISDCVHLENVQNYKVFVLILQRWGTPIAEFNELDIEFNTSHLQSFSTTTLFSYEGVFP